MKRLTMLILAVAFMALSCGYSFEGRGRSMPGNVRRLAIPTVGNSTTEARLTTALTNELIRRFTFSKVVRITEVDSAEAVLKAHIQSVRVEAAVLAVSGDASKSRRVIVSVHALLKRRDDDKVLWESRQIQAHRTFGVAPGQSAVDANLREVLDRIAEDLAEKIHNNTLENF